MKTIGLSILTALALVGCSKENNDGPRAETSVKIDLDGPKSDLEKSLNKAEREIKAGAKEVKEKLADAGDAVKDKLEEAKDKLTNDKKAEVEIKVKKD